MQKRDILKFIGLAFGGILLAELLMLIVHEGGHIIAYMLCGREVVLDYVISDGWLSAMSTTYLGEPLSNNAMIFCTYAGTIMVYIFALLLVTLAELEDGNKKIFISSCAMYFAVFPLIHILYQLTYNDQIVGDFELLDQMGIPFTASFLIILTITSLLMISLIKAWRGQLASLLSSIREHIELV